LKKVSRATSVPEMTISFYNNIGIFNKTYKLICFY